MGKSTHGGAGRGQGRKQGSGTKIKIPLSLDSDIIKKIDEYAKNRSAEVNRILLLHFKHTDQLAKEAEEFGEVL